MEMTNLLDKSNDQPHDESDSAPLPHGPGAMYLRILKRVQTLKQHKEPEPVHEAETDSVIPEQFKNTKLEQVEFSSDGSITGIVNNMKVMVQTGLEGGLVPVVEE